MTYARYFRVTDDELTRINFRGAIYTPGFEIYRTRRGYLAWSPCKDGDANINPLKGVKYDFVTESDIARVLVERMRHELGTKDVSEEEILRDNRDVVTDLLKRVTSYSKSH